jgi:hypothetical protein
VMCWPQWCGANLNCNNAVDGHHRSASRALDTTVDRMSRTLGVTMIGYNMCWRCTASDHSMCNHPDGDPHMRVVGLAYRSNVADYSRDAVSSGYLDIADREERRWSAIRTTQHELSHNFGTYDSHSKPQPCPPEIRCIMRSGSFDGIHWDESNIWCADCQQDFRADRFGG